MSTGAPDLPQELVDLIIDHTVASLQLRPRNALGFPQPKEPELVSSTLRSLCLVSRSFRCRVLPSLFGTLSLTVNEGSPTDRLDSIRDILDSSPFPSLTPDDVGWHINAIFLRFIPRFRDITTAERVIGQESVIKLLQSLLQHAQNAKVLSMRVDNLVQWTALDPAYREAFHTLVRFKSMKHLMLSNLCHIPVTFLKGTHLESLNISQEDLMSFNPEITAMAFAPAEPADLDLPDPFLKNYDTDHSCPFGVMPNISPPGSIFSRLRSLKSTARNHTHIQQTWTILANSPMLERLFLFVKGKWFGAPRSMYLSAHASHLFQKGDFGGSPPTFNLGKLPALQTLLLHHARHSRMPFHATNDQHVTKFLTFLEPSSPLHALETFDLMFAFTEFNVPTDFFYPESSVVSQWEQLDILLMGPKYPALKTVTISLLVHVVLPRDFVDFNNDVFLATTIEKLRDHFPRLSSTDKVLFDIRLQSKVTRSRGV